MMANDMDPAMAKVLNLFEKAGISLEELGTKMGYGPDRARKSAWQFLRKTTDPHISMLRRFAKAMGVTIEELVAVEKNKGG